MSKERKHRRERNYERFSTLFFILLGLAVLATVLLIIASNSPSFANGYNSTVGAAIRAALAYTTSWLPFSLAEILLYSLPIWLVVTVIYAYRRRCGSWKSTLVFLATVIIVLSTLFSLFVFSFGIGYHTDPLGKRMGLESADVTANDLYETAVWLVQEVNKSADGVSFGEDRVSVRPYDRDEMCERLIQAYEGVCDRYDFVQRLDSTVKPVLASEVMSHMHITGVYSFFTGDANLNVNFPDYTLPYTAAHELAHQRGIAREDEANFIAFLVTVDSADAYIRYSGYLNLFEYVANALYKADRELYRSVLKMLDAGVIGEMQAYSDFFDAYRDSALSGVSGAVNDAYLKLNGSEAGTKSYGLVVDLAVAYKKAYVS